MFVRVMNPNLPQVHTMLRQALGYGCHRLSPSVTVVNALISSSCLDYRPPAPLPPLPLLPRVPQVRLCHHGL